MDESTAALTLVIGVRVKQERQSRRWTLDQLAEAAGVSRRMVINVEQGGANPSVGILLRISDALGIGLRALVEPPQPKPVKVTRHGDGAVLWSVESGGRGVLVAGTEAPDVVELWDWSARCSTRTTERIWRRVGWVHGVQQWANLPAAVKFTPPQYQGHRPPTSFGWPRIDGIAWRKGN